MARRRQPGRGRPAERPRGPLFGHRIEVRVDRVAHGGHCVARHEGRVVFVRHALPGESVVALVTEDAGGSFCRADAVEVLDAAPDRVPAPCPYAGPGRCGGCDWQHASPAAQRELKAAVVREQLARLAGVDVPVTVEAVGETTIRWRTRVAFAVDPAGRPGLRRHRSREVEPVEDCLIAVPETLDVLGQKWPGASAVQVEVAAGGQRAVTVTPTRHGPVRTSGDTELTERAAGREWTLRPGVFWQVHPQAAHTLAGCVAGMLRPRPGERALDLYCGAGLFTAVLGGAVGATGEVLGVEGDAAAVRGARVNLADMEWTRFRHAAVSADLVAASAADVVVLDPPRTGAGRAVTEAVCGLGPRAICYVACDPAALARDVRTAAGGGYRLAELRAFDLFPMTHHVECVALLIPVESDP